MTHIQLAIFLENKEGRLHEVCSLLGKNNINIRALTLAESDHFGVLRIIVKDPHKTAEILKNNHFIVKEAEVVAVEINDVPGRLAQILLSIKNHHLNVEYMYGFVEPKINKAMMIFRFDNPQKAILALKEDGIQVISREILCEI